MPNFIEKIEIDGFRALSKLNINSLGSVNLITGKNNSGKSSLLEAIRILSSGGALKTFYDILSTREELGDGAEYEKSYDPGDLVPFCSLFNGFPDLASSQNGFSIKAEGALPAALSSIDVGINWYSRKTDPDRTTFRYEIASGDWLDEEVFPALSMDIGGKKRIVPLDRFNRRSYASRSDVDGTSVPCIYLDPFSSRSTSQMDVWWDAVALTDAEPEIVKALQLVSDDIQAVTMIASDNRSSRPRTAVAKSARFRSRVPLKTFGDGLNRVFGIILSLCNARNGVLLIDEIENGLHYSVQTAVWRTLFRLARDMNVQVFATSHSWDCVRAFQEAAAESPETGVLVRLTSQGNTVIPTLFTEKELQIVTRDQIEVR